MGNFLYYCCYICPRCATCCGLPLRVGALLVGILTVVFKVMAIGVDLCLIEQTLILPFDAPYQSITDYLLTDVETLYLYVALVCDGWMLILAMVLVCGVVTANLGKVVIFNLFFFLDTLRLIGVIVYEYMYLSPLLDSLHPMSQTICGDLAQFYTRLGIALNIILFLVSNSYHHKMMRRKKELTAKAAEREAEELARLPQKRAPSPSGQLVDEVGHVLCPCPDGRMPLRQSVSPQGRSVSPRTVGSIDRRDGSRCYAQQQTMSEGRTLYSDQTTSQSGTLSPRGRIEGSRSPFANGSIRSKSPSRYAQGSRSHSPYEKSMSRSPSPFHGGGSPGRPIIKQPVSTGFTHQPISMSHPQPTYGIPPYYPSNQIPGDSLACHTAMPFGPAGNYGNRQVYSGNQQVYSGNQQVYSGNHDRGGYSRSPSPHQEREAGCSPRPSPFRGNRREYSRSQSPYERYQKRHQEEGQVGISTTSVGTDSSSSLSECSSTTS
nr:PREDICTED: uncharacterized protein LOC109037711 [Bemisia tabaci]